MSFTEKEEVLTALASAFIDQAITALDVREGRVSTVGPPPYRRLDCDGRALAYVRTRPRKDAVRVDVSGLWTMPGPAPASVPSAGGASTLLLRSAADVPAALSFLRSVVEETRTRWPQQVRRTYLAGRPVDSGHARGVSP